MQVATILQVAAISALLAVPAAAQKTSNQNEDRDRGQTPIQERSPNRDKVVTLHGTLIDAACPDRSANNLKQPPAPLPSGKQPSATSAKGVTVDPKTADAERSDALAHQVPDMRTRGTDPTCAVTGSTKAFSLFLDDGRVLNLDEAGNARALEAIESTDSGRAMLNGTGPAVKPKATLKGTVHGQDLVVQKIARLKG